ncbi:hypothetical protein [Arthrobacter sp. NPDC092385]|uniref:hypothetical protein n=1 Tax=Arthrobacter sp. NPDC092385 TaxID=3363943 RepID=UPI0038050CE1
MATAGSARLGLPVLALLLTLPACTIEVPLPPGSAPGSAPATVPASAPPGGAAPAPSPSGVDPGLPPLTRAQITGEDMTFARGSYLAQGESVAFADGMTRSDGWTPRRMMVNGESAYEDGLGCLASLRHTGVQGPLVVDGDDRASTEALFAFLDPSILPEYLVTTTWPWGGSPGESPAGIEFLTYLQPAAGSAPASAVSLRLFSGPRTGLAITVSCPSDDQLAAAVADVRSRVSVVPPRS